MPTSGQHASGDLAKAIEKLKKRRLLMINQHESFANPVDFW
jgi:hypothetical protein